MATKEVTGESTVHGVWSVSSRASAGDMEEQLETEISQLEAMAQAIYGNGFENFSSMNSALRDNYLWAMSQKINAIKVLNHARRHAATSRIATGVGSNGGRAHG